MDRRELLARGFVLAPLAAALLAACGEDGGRWPEGMLPIKWDRDTCARCGMVISDRRFAAQLRGGPKNTAFKFDDIGCAATWCSEKLSLHPWMNDPATRFWVAEFGSAGERWLDARSAHYAKGPRSPMGYDFGAHASAVPGSVAYAALSTQVSATWPADCRPGEAAGPAASAS